jgi:hypothetical protein
VTREERPDTGRDRRIEPRIDWTRAIAAARTHRAPPVPAWRDRRHWRWALLIALLLLVLVVVLRRPLADALWPETRIQALLDQADSALAGGHLDAADGSGARQLYEAAQALDTDRGEAAMGLRRVGQQALRQAAGALAQDRFAEARERLALARELQVPRAQADALDARLRAREAEHAGLDSVMQAAVRAHAAGRLVGDPAAALPLYQRVLALQPARLEALEGREDALSDLLQEAGRHLQRNQLEPAASLIAQARVFDPGHVDLPQAQAALATALETRRRAAARDLGRGRLAAARAVYEEVLAAAPGDAAARQGLEQVGVAHAVRAERHAADFRFEQARRALVEARELAPQSARIAQAEQAVARAEQARDRPGAAMPPGERARRVQTLLADMASAEAQGQWLTPPGESAYDKLRAAQALAPDAPEVKRAASRLLPAVRECYEAELRANRIRRAQACLQAWQTLQPRQAGLADARRRLAEKWIAVGSERLGAGDVAFAAQALEEARRLDAAVSGLDDFQARVRLAQAPQAR